MNETYFFSLDCESIGLYGEKFAYGYTVVNSTGNELDYGYEAFYNCPEWYEATAKSDPDDIAWVAVNVLPALPGYTCNSFFHLRHKFWVDWMKWKQRGALLVADCPYPVETDFLYQCVQDKPAERKWQGPYPFIDVASVMLTVAMNPLATHDRLANELPIHNPLADARQSARLLLEAINSIKINTLDNV